MLKYTKSLYVTCFFALLATVICESAEPAKKIKATNRPVSFERNVQLGRGVNLGNALDAPTEGACLF